MKKNKFISGNNKLFSSYVFFACFLSPSLALFKIGPVTLKGDGNGLNGNVEALKGNEDTVNGNEEALKGNEEALKSNQEAIRGEEEAFVCDGIC